MAKPPSISFADFGNRPKLFSMQKHMGSQSVLTVVIINTSEEFHKESVESVYSVLREGSFAFSVMYIDSSFSPEASSIISDYPSMRYIVPSECSYNKALKLGIEESSSPFVLILNNGCVLEKIDFNDIVNGTMQTAVYSPISSQGSSPRFIAQFVNDFLVLQKKEATSGLFSISVNYNAFLVNRDIYEYLGGIDTNYTSASMGVLDYCYRAYASGFFVVLSESVCVSYNAILCEDCKEDEKEKDNLYFHFSNILNKKYNHPVLKILFGAFVSAFKNKAYTRLIVLLGRILKNRKVRVSMILSDAEIIYTALENKHPES